MKMKYMFRNAVTRWHINMTPTPQGMGGKEEILKGREMDILQNKPPSSPAVGSRGKGVKGGDVKKLNVFLYVSNRGTLSRKIQFGGN